MRTTDGDSYPKTPVDWWNQPDVQCPDGCVVQGAVPPNGREIWCARLDGARHGPATHFSGRFRTDTTYAEGVKHGWETEWRNDRLGWAQEYARGELHGRAHKEYYDWYDDGSYVHGKQQGRWIATRNNGQPAWTRDYDQDVLHGESRRWYPNGQLQESGTYQHGELHGTWTYWHDNGCISGERSFCSGIPDGIQRAWNRAGELIAEVEFRYGTGDWTEYYDSGIKKLDGRYLEARRHGPWSRWGREGQLVGIYELDHGTGNEIEWDDEGHKRSETAFCDGKKHGKQTEWDAEGQIEWVSYHDQGALVTRHRYRDGTLSSITEWRGHEIVRSLDYENGLLACVREKLPDGERTRTFEDGQPLEVRETVGNRSHTVTRKPSALSETNCSYPKMMRGEHADQAEIHELGNIRVSLEIGGGRVLAATVQVGETAGSHRLFRLERLDATEEDAYPDDDGYREDDSENEANAPVSELVIPTLPRAHFALVEIHERLRDGFAVWLRFANGKATHVTEWQHRDILRSVGLHPPQPIGTRNIRGLIDELKARGVVDKYSYEKEEEKEKEDEDGDG